MLCDASRRQASESGAGARAAVCRGHFVAGGAGLRAGAPPSAPTAELGASARTASDARLSLSPPASSCDRMPGVHAHAPHDTSRTSARGSRGRHRRSPLRPRLTHTPAVPSDWRLALLASAVCLLARTPSRTLQRTRAHAAARIHARACRCLHPQRCIRCL